MISRRTGPTVTLAVVAYNHEHWIEKAVRAAFAQTYSPLQIVLSDDGSADRTFHIMQDLASEYDGPHQVVLNRNNENLGFAGHLNRIAELASGEIIILAAGDDASVPNRVADLVRPFSLDPSVRAAFSGYSELPSSGPGRTVRLPRDLAPFTGLQALAKSGGWVGLGATFGYSRECFTTPAKLSEDLICEDRLLPFRAALLGKIAFVPEPLILYRVHEDSATALGRFLSSDYEAKHQRLLLRELEWARREKLVGRKAYRRARRSLEQYPAHFVTMRRLAARPILARAHYALYFAALWPKRLALRWTARFSNADS